jgi:cbb3-type cytochrome oxidase maturation protein
MGLVGLVAFLWSLRSGQYDDLDGAAVRVLLADAADVPLRQNGAEPTKGSSNHQERVRGRRRSADERHPGSRL